MSEEEYQKEKARILSQSKDKGLDLFKKAFKHYGWDIEKAMTTGIYLPELKQTIIIYFDEQKDQWLTKPINPQNN